MGSTTSKTDDNVIPLRTKEQWADVLGDDVDRTVLRLSAFLEGKQQVTVLGACLLLAGQAAADTDMPRDVFLEGAALAHGAAEAAKE